MTKRQALKLAANSIGSCEGVLWDTTRRRMPLPTVTGMYRVMRRLITRAGRR